MPRKVGSPRDCATSAAVEAELRERCGMQRRWWGRAFEYLRLEEWQRWEGNQLLRTERLTLYQAHLETNETLIIAPTGASRLPAPHSVGSGLVLCGHPGDGRLGPSYASCPPPRPAAIPPPGILPKAAAMVWSREGWLSPDGRSGRV